MMADDPCTTAPPPSLDTAPVLAVLLGCPLTVCVLLDIYTHYCPYFSLTPTCGQFSHSPIIGHKPPGYLTRNPDFTETSLHCLPCLDKTPCLFLCLYGRLESVCSVGLGNMVLK